jgi:uncharacterized protein YggE
MPEPVAAPTGQQRTVTVVGQGTARAAPDTAILQLGVETYGATPVEALEACWRALDAVLAALRRERSSQPACRPAGSASTPNGTRAHAATSAQPAIAPAPG